MRRYSTVSEDIQNLEMFPKNSMISRRAYPPYPYFFLYKRIQDL